MCRIGFDSPSEYIDFLKFSEKQDEKVAEPPLTLNLQPTHNAFRIKLPR